MADDTATELDLSGPSKAKRLARLKALLQDDKINSQVVQILLDIESVPSNITEYRDRERHLENLVKTLRNDETARSERTQISAFRYLLGSLYVNFEKFWGPTIRVAVEIIHQTRFQHLLLRILLDHLHETNNFIYDESRRDDPELSEDRPDYILHRNFIFQLMARFPHYIESNCQFFMDQFFLFVQKELLVSPFIEKFGRSDLTQQKVDTKDENAMQVDEVTNEQCKDAYQTKRRSVVQRKSPSDSILQKRKSRETFITVAKIIQSFKKVSSIHRQAELKDLILDLLCCRDSSVQKAAFNCLLSYEIEGLKPYTEKILKILNDKKVRTELSMFSIDVDESDQVRWDDRSQLIPVLQRILFGRMIGQVGKKSSGRDKADLRKALVMRFIAGCTVDEIINFFELLFDPLFGFVGVPYDQLEATLRKNLDIRKYVPPNKLQAMLTSLEAYIESVAHLREGSLPYVLKLINILTYYVVAPLEDPGLFELISHKNIDSLKAIKRGCLNIVTEFFKSFEYYQYSQDEINFIFKFLVWPSSQGFVDRNHASVTPFLRLIDTFARNETYHRLLVKRNKYDKEQYLLDHIITLYQDLKTKRPVLKFIASMIAHILKPEKDLEGCDEVVPDQDRKIIEYPMLNDEDSLEPVYDKSSYKSTKIEIPYGHKILMKSTPYIFERLRKNCQEFIDKKDSSYRIENDELLILSTLSEYLKSSDQSLLATKLLLTTLDHQRSGELILNTLRTAQSLMRQVTSNTDPSIVDYVANILGYQRNNDQRNELCNFIDVLAEKDSNLIPVNKIIRLMNSTSQDLIDTPDLAKWSEGFRLSFEYLENLDEVLMNKPEVIRESLILLIHQTGFIINTIDRYEFSVRENCYIFYEKLAERLKHVRDNNKEFLRQILNDILLDKFLRKGMRDTNDAIKHTYIEVLRILTVYCHEKNRTLSEFNLFCNQNQDLDFWKGIKHIQLHNRSKALARLVASENLEKISPKTLSSYFMPIAAGFLFNKAYKSVASLAENSIKLIGIICRHLNWVTYESTLNYYLGLLTKANASYQRTNIKLITEIIRNFNFDLTACVEAMQYEEDNKKLEKRMKKRLGAPRSDRNEMSDERNSIEPKKLNPSTAKMVYMSITKKLIPQLNSCLHEMTRVEFEHDKNMSNYVPEKDEIKRIPIAFAIVQLLSLLPGRFVLFRDHLPALFLKLVSFLKSKNQETRKAARMTLIKIMTFEPVGPAYMPDLLRVLKQNLDKGFHIHVLNYTIHSVLDKLRVSGLLHYGDLDGSVHELVDSCLHEIFGKVSEDKEIAQVIAKTFEAKKTKSYDTLLILSSYISAEKLSHLVDCIKNQLKSSTEPKKVNKLSVCLQRVFTGLSQNDDFPIDKLLTFIEKTIEESIPSLKVRQKVDSAENPNKTGTNSAGPFREDRFLIAKDRTKERVKSKINEKGNLHIVVENSLRLLFLTFEKKRAEIKRKETLQRRLDGFISLLSTCLKSSSPGCVMRALKCIYFITQTKSDLPSFKTKCNSIVKKIFILLSLYNGVGMVQGENYEMIGMCFKTITLLLLRCEHVQLNEAQVRALMTYIGQDLCDTSRQATAFSTLHSLLQRKCESPELIIIMNKIADSLVTSTDDSIRSLAVKSWQTYLLEYKHEGSALQTHLTKFLRQIDYEYIDGRKSVIRMLRVIVEKFPERILRDHLELFFHLLAQRIVNDESKDVRSSIGHLIALILQRLPDKQAYVLNKFVFPWATGKNPGLKILGIKLISIFLEASKSMFEQNKERITKILSICLEALEESKESVKEVKDNGNSNGNGTGERMDIDGEETGSKEEVRLLSVGDKLSYHSLRMFKRLLDKNLITCVESRYINHLKKIWQNIAAEKLSHWHEIVVLASCELYLIFISSTNLNKSLKVENPSTENYLDWNATRIVRLLCDKFIDLLDRFDQTNKIFNYVVESMILLGQMIANSRATLDFEKKYCESFDNCDIISYLLNLDELPKDSFVHERLPYQFAQAKKNVDLMWLSVKIVMQARKEAALFRLSKSYRRDFVLRWTAAIAQELGPRRIAPYVFLFTMTPVRELTDKVKGKSSDNGTSQQSIVMMSEDLLKFIKSLLGVELFNKVYSKVQLYYTKKRVDRKKTEALMKVRDQARGVKRKIKQHKDKDKKRRQNKANARKEINGRNIRNKRLRA